MGSQSSTRSALGFTILGAAATGSAFALPDPQTHRMLLVVGATFFFGALLSVALSSEEYLRRVVYDSVYADLSRNQRALVDSYELQDTFVYIPREDPDKGVSLFVPESSNFQLPSDAELDALFVESPDEKRRGISLRPSGNTLFGEFEGKLHSEVSDTPSELAVQLSDGLVEAFELVTDVDAEVRPDDGVAEFRVDERTSEMASGFDDPVRSFVAVGLAVGLDAPIVIEAADAERGETDRVLRYRWVLSHQRRLEERSEQFPGLSTTRE